MDSRQCRWAHHDQAADAGITCHDFPWPFTTYAFTAMDMGMYDTTALVFTRLIGSSRSDAQTVEVDQRYLRVYVKRADR